MAEPCGCRSTNTSTRAASTSAGTTLGCSRGSCDGDEMRLPERAIPGTPEVSSDVRSLLDALEHGQLFWFADWPISAVPRSGALVYTVWNRSGQFIYVGMAGRGETSAARGPRTVRPLEQSRQRPPQWRSVLRLRLRPARAAHRIRPD
jgi:hypothetical protein